MDKNHKEIEVKKLLDELDHLEKSPLYKFRKENNYKPVIGRGSLDAEVMFIGEAPGRNEAEAGKPFVGASGRVLDELFATVNLTRADIYITNLVNDRPPENRDPTKKEIKMYSPFLIKLINIIQPVKLCTLGRIPMQFVMEYFGLEDKIEPISSIHGHAFNAKTSYGNIKIIPLFHPAYALYQAPKKKLLVEDIKQLA